MEDFLGDTFEEYNLLYEMATFEHFVNHDPQPRKFSEILKCDINKFMFICSQCESEFENSEDYYIHQILDHQGQKSDKTDDELDNWCERELFDEFVDEQQQSSDPESSRTQLKDYYESAVNKILENEDSNATSFEGYGQTTSCVKNEGEMQSIDFKILQNSEVEPLVLQYQHDSEIISTESRKQPIANCESLKTTKTPYKKSDGKKKKQRTPGRCDVCNRSFNDLYNLRIHKMIHTGEMPFQCEDCGKGFRQYNKLKIHSIIHTNNKPFVCDMCGKGFRYRNYLAIHKRLHTGEKPYKCKLCDEHFHSLHNRRLHVKSTHSLIEENLTCHICDKNFSTKFYLRVHMSRHNNLTDIKCSVCDKTFFTVAKFREHFESHHAVKSPSWCEICQIMFPRSTIYNDHLLNTHLIARPYVCHVCSKVFAQNKELYAHKAICTIK